MGVLFHLVGYITFPGVSRGGRVFFRSFAPLIRVSFSKKALPILSFRKT